MLNIRISDLKVFVHKLLIDKTFDPLLLVEASIKSDVSYHISGRINREFFTDEELEALPSDMYIPWSTQKGNIFNVIKGSKLPLGFKIVLIARDRDIKHIIENNNLHMNPDDVANLAMNILYDGNEIIVTTITSLKTFSLSKELEHLWDQNVKAFLSKNEITFEER